MFLMLDPPVSGPDAITWAAHLRQRGKSPEECVKSIQVRESLLLAPGVERVIGDLDKVKSGESRKPVCRQRSGLPSDQGSSANSFPHLAQDVAFGHSACFSRRDRRTKGLQPRKVFSLGLLQ